MSVLCGGSGACVPLGGAGGDAKVAADMAMAATIYHWGLHPWAIYAVVGVAIAYGVFRKGRPLTISAVFEPLLGKVCELL